MINTVFTCGNQIVTTDDSSLHSKDIQKVPISIFFGVFLDADMMRLIYDTY